MIVLSEASMCLCAFPTDKIIIIIIIYLHFVCKRSSGLDSVIFSLFKKYIVNEYNKKVWNDKKNIKKEGKSATPTRL